jgi:hypothetical protein
MKKIKILVAVLIFGLLYSCSDSKTGDDLLPTDGGTAEDSTSAESEEEVVGNLICLYDKASMVSEPGKNGKWIKTLTFGRELIVVADTTIEDKKYYKAKIAEGTEGWINSYYVEPNAQVWIVTQKTSIYKAPDPLTISELSLEMGDLLVVKDKKLGAFYSFVTKDKKQKGYLKGELTIANDPNAIEAGQVYGQIMAKTDTVERRKALEEFQFHTVYGATSFGQAAADFLNNKINSDEIEQTIEEKIINNAKPLK